MPNFGKIDNRTPTWLSKLRVDIIALRKRQQELESLLMNPPFMKEGCITVQYRTCGRADCRCMDKADPFRHGPYHYLVVQNNKENGVRQKRITNKKDIDLLLGYKKYTQWLVEYKKINEEIEKKFELMRKRRCHG